MFAGGVFKRTVLTSSTQIPVICDSRKVKAHRLPLNTFSIDFLLIR
jgi:hypothetical protein